MSNNPYQAPSSDDPCDRRTAVEKRGEQSFNSVWDTFFWTFMGFSGGTLLTTQVLSAPALRTRMLSGMICGGIPLAVLAFVAAERRRRARTGTKVEDSLPLEEGKTRD